LSQSKRLLLDITRLVVRRLQGRLATGIDRVGLAYFSYLKNRSQALIKVGPFWRVLGEGSTQQLYTLLTTTTDVKPWRLILFLLKASLFNQSGLPSQFNAARGATKWMDYARMGAVGVFTDAPAYQDCVRHGVTGLLLPNESEVWVQNILDLVNNTELREQMRIAANGSFRYVA